MLFCFLAQDFLGESLHIPSARDIVGIREKSCCAMPMRFLFYAVIVIVCSEELAVYDGFLLQLLL